jgi:hypothetical protein
MLANDSTRAYAEEFIDAYKKDIASKMEVVENVAVASVDNDFYLSTVLDTIDNTANKEEQKLLIDDVTSNYP